MPLRPPMFHSPLPSKRCNRLTSKTAIDESPGVQSRREDRTVTVRIIGLGNELVCDDGVGIRIGRLLQTLPLPSTHTVDLRPMIGLDCLEEWDANDAIVIVDAASSGAAPGTVSTLRIEDVSAIAEIPYCSHGFGLAEVLAIAQRLHPDRLPAAIAIVTVEVRRIDRYGTALSPPVQQALTEGICAVLKAAGLPEWQTRARCVAKERADWCPSVLEAIGG